MEKETDTSEEETSGAETWIEWFCSENGNEFLYVDEAPTLSRRGLTLAGLDVKWIADS